MITFSRAIRGIVLAGGCWLLATSAGASAQDRPVPAGEAPGKMTLPPGFQATLFAGEPDVVQPIAFTFDDRGRMWVVECLSYPHWKHDGTGNDRIVMFEDTDGDGKHDVRHVVYDKGSNLSGIELGHGGIWLCSVPNLVFLPCDFNADRPVPAGKSEIVLDGWNIKDTKHNIFNSLIWGPDGWLYGCNGIQSRSFVAPPGTPMKDRTEFNCGVWRYHPTRKIFEPFAHGTTNPFGLDFDEYGEAFITNCVIKHLFHVIPGGHFDRMYGQDVNPYVYKLMPSIADYIHWAGGDWTTSRGNKPEHSDAGGGHAHSGCMVYLGDNFPEAYRNTLFTCNIHGSRINRDILKRQGSGYKSERAKDFMFANDPWFRGIAIKYGPDGGVFVSDWCDTGECHNYDKADITNGRIHKITYGKAKPWRGDLSKLSDGELIKLHEHRNEWFVRHARRILQERWVAKSLEKESLPQLKKLLREEADATRKLRLLMTLQTLGDFITGLQNLSNPDPLIAARSFRIFVEYLADSFGSGAGSVEIATNARMVEPSVKLAVASSIRRILPSQRQRILDMLIRHLSEKDASDPYLSLQVWYAIEPTVGLDLAANLKHLAAMPIPLVREFIARKLAALDPANLDALIELAGNSKEAPIQADVLRGILAGLGGTRQLTMPQAWKAAAPNLLASSSTEVCQQAMVLAVTFDDETAIAAMQKTVRDPMASTEGRSLALRTLLRRGKPDLLPILLELLDDRTLRAEAIRALAAFNDPGTPKRLLGMYDSLTAAEKEDAVQTLASRAEWALALLDAVEAGTIPRKDVTAFVARQMQGMKDRRVGERLAKAWGTIQPASAQRAELTRKYKALLTDESLKSADLARGRLVYQKNCASCHKLYDDGGDIGPALTGSQRSSLDYILENVLDPSAVVPREYQVEIIDLKNERRVNGIIKAETPRSLTVQTTNETLTIPKDEIEARSQSKMSIMPDGILEKLTDQEVRDLVAYLRGREQVPLPPSEK